MDFQASMAGQNTCRHQYPAISASKLLQHPRPLSSQLSTATKPAFLYFSYIIAKGQVILCRKVSNIYFRYKFLLAMVSSGLICRSKTNSKEPKAWPAKLKIIGIIKIRSIQGNKADGLCHNRGRRRVLELLLFGRYSHKCHNPQARKNPEVGYSNYLAKIIKILIWAFSVHQKLFDVPHCCLSY